MNIKWTYPSCYQEATKYHTRTEFHDNNPSAYNTALKHNWLRHFTWFAEVSTRHRWTYYTCKVEAQKYETRSKYKAGCRGAYNASVRYKWINDFFKDV